MQNLYDLNTQLFSYLQLNITSPKDIMLIDKCMNKVNVEGNLFDAWNILIDKYDPKNSVTKNKLISSFDNIKQEHSDTCVEYLNKVLAIKNDLELNFNYIIDDTLFVTKVINNLILKDVDDAKFKLKLQSMNLDVSGLEKELINHDSYLESLKDIISNLDSTIINNSSSALSTSSINVGNNFKKKKKKNNKSKSSNINHHKNNTRYVNNSQHFNNDDKNNKQLLCTKCGNKGHETKFCWSDILCRYCNKKGHPERWCLEKLCTYCGERRHLYDDCPHRNSIKSNDPIRSKRNYVDSRFSNFNNKRSINDHTNNRNYSHNSKRNHHCSSVNDNLHNNHYYNNINHNDHNNDNTNNIDNHNDDHNVNCVDMYHEISKTHETNHVFEENKILIIDEYNPDYVFNKVDEETINEYVSNSSKNLINQIDKNKNIIKVEDCNSNQHIKDIIYPKLSDVSYCNDHYEDTDEELIYKIKYPNRPISSIEIINLKNKNNTSIDISIDDTINDNQNPNLWISDTGESIHVTNYSNVIINRNRYNIDYLKYDNKDKDIIEFYSYILCRLIDN